MDRILVDTVKLQDCSCRIAKLSKQLDNIGNELSGLHMSRKGGAYLTIDGVTVQSSIGRNRRTLDKLSHDTRKLSNAVNQASADFQKTENDLLHLIQMTAGLLESNGSIYLYGLIDALKYPQDTSLWSSTMREKYFETLQNTTVTKDSKGRDVYRIISKEGQQIDEHTIGLDGRLIATFSGGVDGLRKFYEKENRYGKGMSKNRIEFGFENAESDDIKIREPGFNEKERVYPGDRDPGDWKNIGMLAGFSLSAESKNSLFQRDGKYESGLFSAEGEVRIGNADVESSIRGGLFVTKVGPDGKEKRVLSPGVEIKVGASRSLFEATGKAQFGNDLNNIKVEGEVKALSEEAKAVAALGFVDGKFAAKVGSSLEVNLVSATASGSVSIAGVEAKGSVTAKVGVGVRVNLGYKDGVVSGDIGASLGLGVSVKFEVDVGKAVNNVGRAVGKAGKAIWNFFT